MAWVFNKTLWVQDNPPYITAAELNRMETGIDTAGKAGDAALHRVADAALVGGTTLLFQNIPQIYTHLRLYIVGQSQRAGVSNTGFRFTFNNDTAASYNFTYWESFSNGQAVVNGTAVNAQTWGYVGRAPALTRGDNNCVMMATMDIPFYRGAHYKYALCEYQMNDGAVQASGGMARNNYYGAVAPITSINLWDDVGGQLGPQAKASLYGMV